MAYTSINKPIDYFNTITYSGNGSNPRTLTGVGFQPDLIWFKCRQANNHNWFDVIRGSDKIIQSSTSNVEATSTALLTSFDSDGFTVNTDDGVNGSGKTYASWNWKAGGTAVSNTDGSITSSVSANQDAGFSIVSWTGSGANATIGHSLGAVPKMIIIRRRTGSSTNWIVYHESIGNNNELFLNLSNASTSSTRFQSTSPTSSVFSVSSNSAVNESSQSIIAYCFAEKQGYSKFGSYTGNGSTDGTFIYTGFKPSWIMFKRSDAVQDWYIYDNKRSSFNVAQAQLDAMDAGAEGSLLSGDFLSNGFKFRSASSAFNTSGGTYIYMAFAENPLVGTNNIPATAR
jgi:hypothetical protein